MSEKFYTKEFPNGLTLLGQPMENVSSAAMALAVCGGSAYDPDSRAGVGSIASEWLLRGAGDRDSRALNDALDQLGCQHHETVQSEHMQFSAAMLGRNLSEVLGIYGDILQRPRLETETFEPCRQLIAQDLESLEDEPSRKAMAKLQEKFFPHPLGRISYGSAQSLGAITADGAREHVQRHLSPAGAILAVAGAFDWDKLVADVEKTFSPWTGVAAVTPQITPAAGGATHIPKDSAQTHIALAHKAVTSSGEGYYAARIAVAVLSQGMGSRLFTEVREKRGLCYHVSSRYTSLKDYAGMITYAGTRPELAAETMKVTVGELRREAQGVEPEELSRAKTQLRSALVMQGQSTSARANSLATDWYHLGRLRSLDELSAAIQAVTEDDVMDYLKQYPAGNFTVLTIGPEAIDVPAEAESDS